jgi:hypothetical protein
MAAIGMIAMARTERFDLRTVPRVPITYPQCADQNPLEHLTKISLWSSTCLYVRGLTAFPFLAKAVRT